MIRLSTLRLKEVAYPTAIAAAQGQTLGNRFVDTEPPSPYFLKNNRLAARGASRDSCNSDNTNRERIDKKPKPEFVDPSLYHYTIFFHNVIIMSVVVIIGQNMACT
nr:hypothetical protein [Tanacetum cinerariifolium]